MAKLKEVILTQLEKWAIGNFRPLLPTGEQAKLTKQAQEVAENILVHLETDLEEIESQLEWKEECERSLIERIFYLEEEVCNEIFADLTKLQDLKIEQLNELDGEQLKNELLSRVEGFFSLIREVLVKWREQEKELKTISETSEINLQWGVGTSPTSFRIGGHLSSPSSSLTSPIPVHIGRPRLSRQNSYSNFSGSPSQREENNVVEEENNVVEEENNVVEERKKPMVIGINARRLKEKEAYISSLENQIVVKEEKITDLKSQLAKLKEVERDNRKLEKSLSDLIVYDTDLVKKKDKEINSLKGQIAQKRSELSKKEQKIEDLSKRVLELEMNASGNSSNLQLATEKTKYQILMRNFQEKEAELFQNNLEIKQLQAENKRYEEINLVLADSQEVVGTTEKIQILQEWRKEVESLNNELEYYKNGTDFYCPLEEEGENLCQELTKKEDLQQAKNEVRNQYFLNQREDELVEEATSIEQLMRVIKEIFEDRQRKAKAKKEEIARRLGTPIELPNSTPGLSQRVNSENSYFHRRSTSLFDYKDLCSSSPSPLTPRPPSGYFKKGDLEDCMKDVKIDELEAEKKKLELKLSELEKDLQQKQEQRSELTKNQERPVENDNFSLNLQDHRDDAQNQDYLISFLSHPKVSGSILTVSLLIIGGLIWKIKRLQKSAKHSPLVISSKDSVVIN